MMKVFISYRREDSEDISGRMCDRLVGEFGVENVFFDVDSIGSGENFREKIEEYMRDCSAMLVVIGNAWTGEKHSRKKIDDVKDFVRYEVSAAFDLGVPIFPILVGGASMPSKDSLPSDIRVLADINAHVISSGPGFHENMGKIIDYIKEAPKGVGRPLKKTGGLSYPALKETAQKDNKLKQKMMVQEYGGKTFEAEFYIYEVNSEGAAYAFDDEKYFNSGGRPISVVNAYLIFPDHLLHQAADFGRRDKIRVMCRFIKDTKRSSARTMLGHIWTPNDVDLEIDDILSVIPIEEQ